MDSINRVNTPSLPGLQRVSNPHSGNGQRQPSDGQQRFEQELEREADNAPAAPVGQERNTKRGKPFQPARPVIRSTPSEGEFHIDVLA